MKMRLTAMVLAITLSGCADEPDGAGSAGPPDWDAVLAESHEGYVPRFDAFAVNCELCDSVRTANRHVRETLEWHITRTESFRWTTIVLDAVDHWRKMEEEYGPNSDIALINRDHVVKLYRKARDWAGWEAAKPPHLQTAAHAKRIAAADLLEGILKR